MGRELNMGISFVNMKLFLKSGWIWGWRIAVSPDLVIIEVPESFNLKVWRGKSAIHFFSSVREKQSRLDQRGCRLDDMRFWEYEGFGWLGL